MIAEINFARFSEVIARHPDLLGVYCVGGGQKGVAAALEAAGVAQSIVHDRSQLQRRDQAVPAVGHDRRGDSSGHVTHRQMPRWIVCSARKPLPANAGIPVEIITRENLMYR